MSRPSSKARTVPAARRRVSAPPRVVRFRMPSDRAAIPAAVERVLEAVHGSGLSHERANDLAVAVSEALSNAAIHGNKLEAGSEVAVTAQVFPGRKAVVEVEDTGAGFDRSALADPTDPTRVLATGGRGVFLMRRLVDHLEYNAAGNRVRLTMEQRVGRRRKN